MPLVDTPLTKWNAHNFLPNQPNIDQGIPGKALQNLYDMIDCFGNLDGPYQEVVYIHNYRKPAETPIAVDCLCGSSEKIFLISAKRNPLYFVADFPREGKTRVDSTQVITDKETYYDYFVDRYFFESNQKWQDSGLNSIWDKREFLALNFDPYCNDHIENYFDRNTNHYYLDAMELFTSHHYIHGVFDYLELSIDQERYSNWKAIYQEWTIKHQSRLLFSTYFDTIIDYIINGHELDLGRFNLDLYQEAVIQRCLIYKHNLNLKTWKLEKFINTKQLHNLLEPNQHNLKIKLIDSV